MLSGVFSRYRSLTALCLFFLLVLSPVYGEWNAQRIAENRFSLDTIWGISDDDMYAISFAGKVFHKDETGWTDISPLLFTDASATIFYIPYGVWGTSSDNVYVVGSKIDYNLGDDALLMGAPAIFHYNGSAWSRITLSKEQAYLLEGPAPAPGAEDTRTGKFYPNWLVGIWGTSEDGIYFTGGKFTRGEEAGKDPISGGIILHYNDATETFTGEIGVGDLLNDDYTDPLTSPMPMVNEITGINGHLYAVGLKGLILHKETSWDFWEIMPTESTMLNFFRVWAADDDDVFAAGFSSSSTAGVIYRYNGDTWNAMTIPKVKSDPSSDTESYIAALWGIWGENSSRVHAVGNAGATIYYDGNPGNIWKQMISDTTTSLNCVWGTSFNNVYAAGEDGQIHHYTEGIKTAALGGYPRHCIAPTKVEFTDTSVGEVDRWEWDFGEGSLDQVSPTADLDYKILVTAVKGSSMNGARIVVRDNGAAVTGVSMDSVAPVSATADLGDNPNTDFVSEGLIRITAKPGKMANAYSIHVLPTGESQTAAIHRYQTGIYLKVNHTTTLGDMAGLLESLDDLVESAVPVNPSARWFESNPASSSVQFKGGQNDTINVRIDSGVSTQADIAAILRTHEKIISAVADTPGQAWVRGDETVSNIANFSGGLEDRNVYVNTDKTLPSYYMAWHRYDTPGEYTTKMTIHRPDVPGTAEIVVKKSQRPDDLSYDQGMILVSVPGTSMNGIRISMVDGGPGTTPSIAWTDDSITLTLDSGVTTQLEAANLLLTHPLILGAVPSEYNDPWYSSSDYGSDSTTFYNGLAGGTEFAETSVTVFGENPLDFTINPSQGVKQLTATFRESATPEIKSKIARWTWYFKYIDPQNPGNAGDGSIITVYDFYYPITFTYDKIGTYNVRLFVLLEDNSPFECIKNKVITVKSPDEGKSSFEGGSGMDSVKGCFIESSG